MRDEKTITEIANECYEIAKEKGWHEKKNPIAQSLMLMVSELAEAMEEVRKGRLSPYYIEGKPEGVVVELADCVIRIFDTCVEEGLDIEEAISIKMEYNKNRSYRHGGKLC